MHTRISGLLALGTAAVAAATGVVGCMNTISAFKEGGGVAKASSLLHCPASQLKIWDLGGVESTTGQVARVKVEGCNGWAYYQGSPDGWMVLESQIAPEMPPAMTEAPSYEQNVFGVCHVGQNPGARPRGDCSAGMVCLPEYAAAGYFGGQGQCVPEFCGKCWDRDLQCMPVIKLSDRAWTTDHPDVHKPFSQGNWGLLGCGGKLERAQNTEDARYVRTPNLDEYKGHVLDGRALSCPASAEPSSRPSLCKEPFQE